MKLFNFLKNEKFKFSSISTGITIGFIVIVVLLNVVLNYLVQRYPLKADITEKKIYELSKESVNYLKNLNKDVEFTVLRPEADFTSYYKELINNYQRNSNKITIKYIDAVKNPTYLTEKGFTNVTDAEIVISSSDKNRYRGITASDLSADQNGYLSAEQKMTAAILYVTKENVYPVYFIQGHGTSYPASFENLFKNSGFDVKTINLMTDTPIDTDAKFLVINSPTVDFSSEEINKIDKFLSNSEKLGKNLFVFSDLNSPALPNLEAYIGEWGMKLGTEKVVDLKNLYQSFMFADYADVELAGDLITNGVSLFIEIGPARPVTILFDKKDIISVKSIATSMADSYTKPAGTEMTKAALAKTDSDKSGPFNLAALSTKTRYDANNNPLISNVFVSGTLSFTSEELTSSSYYGPYVGNGQYFLNILQKMSGDKDALLNIPAKNVNAQPLKITDNNTLLIIVILTIIIIPAIILAIGIFLWLRRRHL